MTEEGVDVSCVVLTWNSAAYVEHCLQSVAHDLSASGLRHEFLIVDNGSSDGTLEMLAGLPFEVTVVPLGHNTGTTFSRNIGLRMARGRYIAVLDSDMEMVEPETVRRLIDQLQARPGTGIIAPRLFYPSGRYQKTTDVFPTLGVKIRRYLHLREIEAREGEEAEQRLDTTEVDYAISAFWLFERGLVDAIGYLDEKIFYAPEDVDYCIRAWLAGRPVLYHPAVSAVHHAQEISRKGFLSKSMRLHIVGLAYYFWKYRMLISCRDLYRRIAQARAHGPR